MVKGWHDANIQPMVFLHDFLRKAETKIDFKDKRGQIRTNNDSYDNINVRTVRDPVRICTIWYDLVRLWISLLTNIQATVLMSTTTLRTSITLNLNHARKWSKLVPKSLVRKNLVRKNSSGKILARNFFGVYSDLKFRRSLQITTNVVYGRTYLFST